MADSWHTMVNAAESRDDLDNLLEQQCRNLNKKLDVIEVKVKELVLAVTECLQYFEQQNEINSLVRKEFDNIINNPACAVDVTQIANDVLADENAVRTVSETEKSNSLPTWMHSSQKPEPAEQLIDLKTGKLVENTRKKCKHELSRTYGKCLDHKCTLSSDSHISLPRIKNGHWQPKKKMSLHKLPHLKELKPMVKRTPKTKIVDIVDEDLDCIEIVITNVEKYAPVSVYYYKRDNPNAMLDLLENPNVGGENLHDKYRSRADKMRNKVQHARSDGRPKTLGWGDSEQASTSAMSKHTQKKF